MAKFCKVLQQPLLTVLLLALGFSSCKTTRNLPTVVAKPMSTAKLLRHVEDNAFNYDNFSVKRMNCQFSTDKSSTSFRVNLKAIRDKAILVSISKLNIPVGRVLLTPDSVKYVNYMDRNYFIDDYRYLSSLLNIDLDFTIIQSIISNNAFSYRNNPKSKDFKNFDSYIESGRYVLQSEKDRKMVRLEEKGRVEKVERRMRKLDSEALILQRMYFNPANFALTKLLIIDRADQRKMEMDFDEFINVDGTDYPGFIAMNFISEEQEVNLRVRLSGCSTEKLGPLNLSIPKKYREIQVN